MMDNVTAFENMLIESIRNKDAEKAYLLIEELKKKVKNDPEVVKWIVDPSTLKKIHSELVEHLDVPLKAMLIKNRVPHRQRRAVLFVEGISNGLKRVLE